MPNHTKPVPEFQEAPAVRWVGAPQVLVQCLHGEKEYRFASANLEDAIAKLVAIHSELGHGVSFSGQTRLRLPKSLHATLSFLAEKEGVSLNTYLVHLLGMQVGKVEAGAQVLRPTNINNFLVVSKKVLHVIAANSLHEFKGCPEVTVMSCGHQ